MHIYVNSRSHIITMAVVKKLLFVMFPYIFCVTTFSDSVLEHYLPSIHANEGSRDELIEKYFSPGFSQREILCFLLLSSWHYYQAQFKTTA